MLSIRMTRSKTLIFKPRPEIFLYLFSFKQWKIWGFKGRMNMRAEDSSQKVLVETHHPLFLRIWYSQSYFRCAPLKQVKNTQDVTILFFSFLINKLLVVTKDKKICSFANEEIRD